MRRYLLALLTAFVLVSPGAFALADEQPPEAESRVAGIRYDYPGELPPDINDLVDIGKGDVLSPKKVRESIKLLYLKELFSNIIVEGENTPEGVLLTYHLVPRLRVSRIDIDGNDNLSKKKIISAMAQKEGDFLDEKLIRESTKEILRLYEDEGFRHAQAAVRTKEMDPLHTDLIVKINEGAPTIIKEIDFTGDLALPESEVAKKTGLKAGKTLKKEETQKAVDNLNEYYVKKDYVRADIEGPTISYTDDNAVLNFHILAGPVLDVTFEGNSSISPKKLKKVLTFWEDRDVSEESISENLDKIRGYYQEEGFYFASVKSRTEETLAPPKVTVKFIVDEGPRSKLTEIDVSGNKEIKKDEIKDVMELKSSSIFKSRHVTDAAVKRDVDRIKAYYETKGFLKAEIKSGGIEFSPDRKDARLIIDVNEGPRTYVTGIDIQDGKGGVAVKNIRRVLKEKEGKPFNPELLKDDQNAVLNIYSQKGYTSVAVDVGQDFSADYKGVLLAYRITEGMPVRVGKIIIRGNEDTKYKVLRRELLLKTGQPLDYEKILLSQQHMYKLGIFSQVRIQPVDVEKPEPVKDLLVTVKERYAGAVNFGVGYGDFDKERGFAEVSYRDLFGLAHTISLRGDLSFKQTKGILSYKWPWFLGYHVDFRTSFVYLDAQKPNYHIKDLIGISGFDKRFGDHITSSLLYQYERVKFGDVRPDATLAPEDQKKSNVASITPSAVFDYRDNPFNPTTGSDHSFYLKFANKFLGSSSDFVKLVAQTNWYFPVHDGIIAALSARGGIAGWGGKFDIPISDVFFLGGASSLRGYNLDSVGPRGADGSVAGGDSMALFNAEVRYPLPYGFGFVTFIDAGNVWLLNKNVSTGFTFRNSSGQAITQIQVPTETEGLRYGTGVGIRYNTPVGPLRVDYGFKVGGRLKGESAGELHFTLGQAF
ncbi:MAG: outer membrane protein assembly factor BamA [Nitrospirota bacterium]